MSAKASSPLLTETIQLKIETPGKVSGLQNLIEQLDRVKTAALAANRALAGIDIKLPDTAKIIAKLQAASRSIPVLDVAGVAKTFKLPLEQFKSHLEGARKAAKADMDSWASQTFKSIPKAATWVASFQREQQEFRRLAVKNFLTPTVGSEANLSLKGGKVNVDAAGVKLVVEGAQIAAEVKGVVKLVVPAEQIAGEITRPASSPKSQSPSPESQVSSPKSHAGHDATTGQFTEGNTEGGRRGGKKARKGSYTPLDLPESATAGEFARRRVVDGSGYTRETISKRDAGKIVEETWDNAEQAIIRSVEKSVTGESPLQEFRRQKQLAQEGYKTAIGALPQDRVGRQFGMARALTQQANQLQTLISPELAEALGPAQAKQLQDVLNAQATTLLSKAGGAEAGGQATFNEMVRRQGERHAAGTTTLQSKTLRDAVAGAAADVAATRTTMKEWEERHPDLFRSGAGKTHFFASMARASDEAADDIDAALKSQDRADEFARRYAARGARQHRLNASLFRTLGGVQTSAPGVAGFTVGAGGAAWSSGGGGGSPIWPLGGPAGAGPTGGGGGSVPSNPSQAMVLYRRRPRWEREPEIIDAEVVGEDEAINVGAKPVGGKKPSGGGEDGESEHYKRFKAGLSGGFTPMGFLANLTKVAGWATAVTVLYKSIELARYSFERFIEVGEMTARLDVVFRKVGGSAQELTGDILKLAAANAQETEAAMESATEWARLGLTRKGVGEAVQVSLAAANVAHMKPQETTKQLSTLMHVFELDAEDLNGVLGMLTATSQRYNVSLEDLFTGLDRSSATAKQAKMSLGELQALIAVMVGRTGQSGIIVGNTIKNLVTQFNNPTFQQYLRNHGVEWQVTEGENRGQVKPASQLMRELFVKYQGMSPRDQTFMAYQWGGRLQVGRVQSFFNGYVDAQKLAVDTQLQLNAAQEANARILGTLKAQLTALGQEWDKMMMAAGTKFGPDMAEWVRGMKNGLRWAQKGEGALGTAWDFATGAPSEAKQAEFRKRQQAWLSDFYQRKGRAPEDWERELQSPDFAWRQWDRISAAALPGKLIRNVLGLAADDVSRQEWLKFTQESPYEQGTQAFNNRAQMLAMRTSSSMAKANLFETVRDVLPLVSPDLASSWSGKAASAMSLTDANAFRALQATGDMPGAQAFLTAQAAAARKQGMQDKAAETLERQNRLDAAKQELATVERQIQVNEAAGKSVSDLRQQQQYLNKEIDGHVEALERSKAALEEEIGRTGEAIFLKQEYVNLLKQQELVAQSLSQLSQQGNPELMGVRRESQAGELQDEVDLLEEQKRRLEEDMKGQGVPSQESVDAHTAIVKQLSEKNAQLAAVSSPQMAELADLYDSRAIEMRRAHAESASWAVGPTETHRLLSEEHGTQEELYRLRRKANGPGGITGLSDAEAARYKQLEVDLLNTQTRIIERQLELRRQERQIAMDAQREFNKGLLLSGPGEMLQRLQVAQMLHRNVSAGEFYSMSPEVRRMYFEARGGEAGMMNRWEQDAMNRAARSGRSAAGASVEMEEQMMRHARGQIGYANEVMRANARGSIHGLPQAPLPGLEQAARTVTANLGAMNTGVVTVTRSLGVLTSILARLGGGIIPAPAAAAAPTAPKMDISAGYSLGSAPVSLRPGPREPGDRWAGESEGWSRPEVLAPVPGEKRGGDIF